MAETTASRRGDPNLIHDMHDGHSPKSVADGDAWLKEYLDGYYQWGKSHNSLLIVTESVMHKSILTLLLVLITAPLPAAEWKLVWSDDFDKPGPPDPAKWSRESEEKVRLRAASRTTIRKPQPRCRRQYAVCALLGAPQAA